MYSFISMLPVCSTTNGARTFSANSMVLSVCRRALRHARSTMGPDAEVPGAVHILVVDDDMITRTMIESALDKLYTVASEALHSPEVKDKLFAQGAEAAPSTSADFERRIHDELKQWDYVIREAKIKAE